MSLDDEIQHYINHSFWTSKFYISNWFILISIFYHQFWNVRSSQLHSVPNIEYSVQSLQLHSVRNFQILTASLNQAVLNNFQHNARNTFVRTIHLPLNLCCKQTCTLCQIFHSEDCCLTSFNKRVKIIWKTLMNLPRKAALLDFSSLSKSK